MSPLGLRDVAFEVSFTVWQAERVVDDAAEAGPEDCFLLLDRRDRVLASF